MASLSEPDVRAFLSHGTRTGKLGWTARDGRPLLAPIRFLLEGEGEDSTLVSGARYTGADRAAEFGPRNAVPGELVVRITATKIVASLDMTA
jgi:hypothetical protein